MSPNLRTTITWISCTTLFSILMSAGVTHILFEIDPEVVRSDVQLVATVLPVFIAPLCTILVLKEKFKAQRLAAENEKLAHTDMLTSLPNRRAFFQSVGQSCHSTSERYAYMLCDIDNFKKFNDTFGHDTGDQVLIHVARILETSIPDCAIAARLGGEEFAVWLPVKSTEEAGRVALRIVQSVESHPLLFQGNSHVVTLSIGVSVVATTMSQSSAMSRADEAMYQAKSNGKNQFSIAA